jgi:hypothetical protein
MNKAVLRTVRKGVVKINGRTYSPSRQWKLYDGRLDGLVLVFDPRELAYSIVMLGTPGNYRSIFDKVPNTSDGKGPWWTFWHRAEAKR